MSEYYVDNWSDLVKEEDKENWTEWELWHKWSDKYEWEDIEVEELEPHDTFIFRDLIFDVVKTGKGKKRLKKFIYIGERLHIAEWIQNKDGFMYLKTIHTEGDRPLKSGTKTKRKIKNASRYGLKRFPLGQGAMLTNSNGKPAINSTRNFENPVSKSILSKDNNQPISRFQSIEKTPK